MRSAKPIREAAAAAGYKRDEVIRIGHAYTDPVCTHLKLVESRLERYWPVAYRNDQTGSLYLIGTCN